MNKVIFDSISQIPEWINAHPVAGRHNTSEEGGSDKSWDAGLGFKGAMHMAADGGYWAAGAKKMIEATSDMDLLKHDGLIAEIDYDVTGRHLDIDEYLSGSPECWEQVEEVETPVVSIGVQAYTPGHNDQKDFTNRGAAMLSVIDDLEAKGIRVELWSCVSGKYRGNKEIGIDMRTCLKRAEENWSPSSVAFGLANAAFGRRLGFRVVEAFKDLQSSGYLGGHALDFEDDRPDDSEFDVWFGYNDMVKSESSYGTVKSALKRVTKEIEQQLKEKKIGN